MTSVINVQQHQAVQCMISTLSAITMDLCPVDTTQRQRKADTLVSGISTTMIKLLSFRSQELFPLRKHTYYSTSFHPCLKLLCDIFNGGNIFESSIMFCRN